MALEGLESKELNPELDPFRSSPNCKKCGKLLILVIRLHEPATTTVSIARALPLPLAGLHSLFRYIPAEFQIYSTLSHYKAKIIYFLSMLLILEYIRIQCNTETQAFYLIFQSLLQFDIEYKSWLEFSRYQ